jgi:hypothetical protein
LTTHILKRNIQFKRPTRQLPDIYFLDMPVVAATQVAEGVLMVWQSARQIPSPSGLIPGSSQLPAVLPVSEWRPLRSDSVSFSL